ncbi:MAG: DUF4031 domain-containing protein [Actinobacteria bacterium]|nr:DUF4031 domain-containing protein [Actinomycetota bacterium]
MTVLVDAAVWKWQGARWAHLVSDESFDELHEFAQRIGKRRLGFQGDHYDVEEVDRHRAMLDLGSRLVTFGDPGMRLRAMLPFVRSLDQASRSALYVDDQHLVMLFDWVGPEAVVELEGIDRVWAGAPRADGERSLELFVRR